MNLQLGVRRDADGLYTLGLYHNDAMGRWIELFYGSMRAVHPDCDEDALRELLSETLRHELTHHLENMAGDRSLELWDEAHRAELLSGFYDDDCATAQFAGWNLIGNPFGRTLYAAGRRTAQAEVRAT